MNNNGQLSPVVKQTCDRLRASSMALQNGKSEDPKAMGQAIADIGYLLANIVESEFPTKASCEAFRSEISDEIKKGNGINGPTAVTIITVTGMVIGLVYSMFG